MNTTHQRRQRAGFGGVSSDPMASPSLLRSWICSLRENIPMGSFDGRSFRTKESTSASLSSIA